MPAASSRATGPERERLQDGGPRATGTRVGLVALAVVLAVLSSRCVSGETQAPSTARAAGESKPVDSELRRPLHVPAPSSGRCLRTPGGRPAPHVAIALGSGPAYPVPGLEAAPPSHKGVVRLYANERKDGAYWHKILWAVDPRYDGPVLIRGRGLDPPQALRFVRPSAGVGGLPEDPVYELEFPAQESASWRYGPSVTILPGPGCYAFQVDGTTFSRVIVFEAAIA